ncbi:MAG: multicopper oxidase family protein [Gammaproteobacteria bacterium]|nr:multicopper oxidase family protein [Gammaproteobacteria bacterium]MDH3447964.1 multicopper oxidase family protein [Gammaproteobacteria bacterium]
MPSRRDFIKAGAAGVLGAALVRPHHLIASEPALSLTASEGRVVFGSDQENPTRVMYYNQSIPGPLIRIPQGRESVIRFHNGLDEASSVHWHGLRIDNAMDGVPDLTQAPVRPGERFEYRLTPPDAGTYWYHSHMRSWAQLALGLAGVLIVDERNPPPVDQDLVFAIDDWRLDRAMQLDTASLGSMHDWSHAGRLGNFITVNGNTETTYPVASGERIRLRLVNIANARIMNLLFHEPQISVVAVDGQPVKPYAPGSGRVILAPGQRTDLILDMTGAPGDSSIIELVIGEYAYEIASFSYGQEVRREQLPDTSIALPENPANRLRLPDQLQHVPLLMEGGAMGGMRSATFEGREMDIRELVQRNKVWAINGVVGMTEEPLFRVRRGTAISLDVVNDNSWPHAMHVHGHHFIDDRNPGTWRDTTLFNRAERGAMQFIADNPGKWLIHCHMVEHMAGGMVTWFEVT